MLVTLVAILCHVIAGVTTPVCVNAVVTTSDFPTLAGKADAPVDMPGLTFNQCQINGQAAIADWMKTHPIYHAGWWLAGWKCVPGRYADPKRA